MDSDRVFEGEKKRPKGLFYVISLYRKVRRIINKNWKAK